ncbi:hypothetical protein Q0F99_11340 [Rathayibacter oskolensis]|uniref:hypothetical protein n=1 Tax=Rathayibacter oskolensis TaxID=1891671 RepID=UPI00265EE3BF|nr:hypothetical protein [Rathayibacter oskolensis]WKK70462.1 hypothetical protein Q0F99_11340 [Rathayibacter oskolensis]
MSTSNSPRVSAKAASRSSVARTISAEARISRPAMSTGVVSSSGRRTAQPARISSTASRCCSFTGKV